MVEVLIARTSDDFWYCFKEFSTFESLLTFVKENGSVVVEKNWHYGNDPKEMLIYWDGLTLEDAKKITECEFKVEIYDTWRE